MAITYVNDLRLSEMGTGDNSGTWGTVTNTNLELIGEALGFGTEAITTNADTHTSTIADGSTDPVRAMYVKYTGTLDSACTITIGPNTVNKFYYIENATSGSQNIIISQGSGANVTIPAGDVKAVYLDGAGSGAAVTDAFASLNVVDLKVQDDLTVTDDVSIGGLLTVTGGALLNGTTPTLTIGDAGAEDAKIVFDGNAADYHVGLDDSEDAFQIGLGSALGTTPRITIRAAEVVVNDLGIDLDFRVETNGRENTLFVDGGNDAVVIGESVAHTTISGGTPAFQVSGEGFRGGAAIVRNDNGAFGPFVALTKSRNTTPGSFTIVQDDDNCGTISWFADDGTNLDSQVAVIGALIDGTPGANDTPGRLVFSTTADGSAAATERLRISSDGTILIATGSDLITNTASGTTNTRIGTNAGDSIVASNAGVNNIMIGLNAGTAIDSGDTNICIGVEALEAEDDHANNIAIGYQALHVQDSGRDTYNIAIGYQAGLDNTTGFRNILIGAAAGAQASTADSHMAIGYNAGGGVSANPLTGNENTCIGYSAGQAIEGTTANNTFVGSQAGLGTTTGYENVSLGYRALYGNVQGRHSVAIGVQALDVANPDSATSQYNTAVGSYAGLGVTTGSVNTLIGGFAGRNVTTSSDNTMLGYSAGYFNTTGANSTFLGSHAGYGIDATKLTGDNNTAVGYQAGFKLQGAATGNQLFGNFAGDLITTGTYNVCLGYDVGSSIQNLTTGNKNVLIGYKTSGPTTGDNAIGIGDSVTVVANDFTFGKASNLVTNDFDADANWSRSSDERLKKNITNQTLGLDFINDLRTVKYNWKPSDELDANDAQLAHLRREDEDGNIINDMNTDVVMHNFIAQEVKAALNTAGVSEFGGWKEDQFGVQQVSREMFVIPLVKAVQELSTKLDAALARIATLEG